MEKRQNQPNVCISQYSEAQPGFLTQGFPLRSHSYVLIKSTPPNALIRLGILVHTAIAGASFAAVIQLASRENLDQVLILAIFCFAVALPASVAMIFISQLAIPEGMKFSEASQVEKKKLPLLSYLIPLAEQVSFFAGVMALFWSFNPIASILLLVVSFLALLAVKQIEKML